MYITQEIVKRIRDLAKNRKVKTGTMLSECGLGINALSEFDKGKHISCISLATLSDYLDCSVDYILGRTSNPNAHKAQNSYAISNRDTVINGMQANVINSEPFDTEVLELAQLIKSLPIVKRAEAVLAIEEIKNK